MTDVPDLLSSFARVTARPAAIIAVAASVHLLTNLPDALGYGDFVDEHRQWFGIAFIASLAVLVVDLAVVTGRRINRWMAQNRELVRREERKLKARNRFTQLIAELEIDDKHALRDGLRGKTRVVRHHGSYEQRRYMCERGILDSGDFMGSCRISDYTWAIITEQPDLVVEDPAEAEQHRKHYGGRQPIRS